MTGPLAALNLSGSGLQSKVIVCIEKPFYDDTYTMMEHTYMLQLCVVVVINFVSNLITVDRDIFASKIFHL